jgi:sulfite exporter TauE/SafE
MMPEFGLLGAFAMGLLGGVHCMGMCGGIVGAISLSQPGAEPQAFWPRQLGYNLGRIASYAVAGMLVGGLGTLLAAASGFHEAQRLLMALAGVFMLLIGLHLGGWLHLLGPLERAGGLLWKRIEPLGRGLLPVRSARQAFMLGLVWGWLPCGLVYSALIWALSAGGALQGGLLMLAFGLGTLPNLLLMGATAARLGAWVRRPAVRWAAGGMLIGFAAVTLLRAMGVSPV